MNILMPVNNVWFYVFSDHSFSFHKFNVYNLFIQYCKQIQMRLDNKILLSYILSIFNFFFTITLASCILLSTAFQPSKGFSIFGLYTKGLLNIVNLLYHKIKVRIIYLLVIKQGSRLQLYY